MENIWGQYKIPVLGVTGEISSGKTLFCLSIDSPENTCVWDLEKSSESYEISMPGLKRIDLHDTMIRKAPGGYTPEQLFSTWITQVHALKPGQFTVGVVDPISEIEAGLCDYVLNHPTEFGKTPAQFQKSGGIYWGVVKDLWKRILMELATKFQTFAYTTHLRQVFEGNAPVRGMKEPKGKDTLNEAASLCLWLERSPGSEVPSARVLKTRLVRRDPTGVLKSILPPRIKIATPAEIRRYINEPADFNNLKPWEKPVKQEISEEDKLALRLATANAEKEAAEAKLALAATIQGTGKATMATTPAGEVVLRKQDAPGGAVKQEASPAP